MTGPEADYGAPRHCVRAAARNPRRNNCRRVFSCDNCVVRTRRDVFDRLATGQEPLYTAWVRNELRTEGEERLAYLVQRVLPGPPGAHHPRAFASQRRRPA